MYLKLTIILQSLVSFSSWIESFAFVNHAIKTQERATFLNVPSLVSLRVTSTENDTGISTTDTPKAVAVTDTKRKGKSSNYNKRKKSNSTGMKFKKSKQTSVTNGSDDSLLPSNKSTSTTPSLHSITDLKLGSLISGYVSGFTSFGAFVKIDYDLLSKNKPGHALLHISQIQDEIVSDPKDVLELGQKLENLRVISINYAKGEVGLSLRNKRPKRTELKDIEIGSEQNGTVTSVVSYGVFIDIGASANVLLHISRISQQKIVNIRDYVNEGDVVTVRIISKDEEKKTIAASLLDKESDLYLDRRAAAKKKIAAAIDADKRNNENHDSFSELQHFEEAVKDLEQAFGAWTQPNN